MLSPGHAHIGRLYRFHTKMYTYPTEGTSDISGPYGRLWEDAWSKENEIVTVIGGTKSKLVGPTETHKNHIDYYIIHRSNIGVRLAEIDCFLKCTSELK